MEILALRTAGEYSKVLNWLQMSLAVKMGRSEDAMQLSPLVRLYGTELVLLGYSPGLGGQCETLDLVSMWNADLWMSAMPLAIAIGRPFVTEFGQRMRQFPQWKERILPIYPDDFRCVYLPGILRGHVARYRHRLEVLAAHEGDSDPSFELVTQGDRVAFPWESWFLTPDKEDSQAA